MSGKATEVLMNEHRGIEQMLTVAEKAAQRVQAGGSVPPVVFLNMADFLRNFADKCHHSKEETQLFPAMEKAGVPRDGGPIAVMLAEHEQGRGYIRTLVDASERYAKGDKSATAPLLAAVRGYVALLRAHIEKEDGILFPMADAVLKTPEQARLYDAFEDIETNVMGPGVHERYHAMLDEMSALAATW